MRNARNIRNMNIARNAEKCKIGENLRVIWGRYEKCGKWVVLFGHLGTKWLNLLGKKVYDETEKCNRAPPTGGSSI